MNTRGFIDRDIFFKLDDKDLLRIVFPEEFLMKIRGKHYSYKQNAFKKLSKGQHSLFMFMVLYFHNIFGWELFLSQYEYEVNNGAFDEYKSGIDYLGDANLLDIVVRCERNYFSKADLQQKQLIFKKLDSKFKIIKDSSLKNAADFVRNHPEEFVIFRTE